MTKRIVFTDKAPKAIGPYSVGVVAGEIVYTAGQLGIDPQTGNLVEGGIEPETRQVMNNLKNILEAAGSNLDQAVKTTVYLKDINEFAKMNAIYGEYFKENPPVRATVQVAALPKSAALQIEVVALLIGH
jgi:2-iminobutanoate/2-iminopropanoate deaminase